MVPGSAGARGRALSALWRLAGVARRRLGWGVADQGVSSLTNFAVSIEVARTLGAAQFGAYSLAFVTYAFALNASRGLSTDPFLVRMSGVDTPTWRQATASCTGTAAAVGLVSAAGALVAGALLPGTTGAAFVALGLTLPGLLLQDSWRYAFFAHRRGAQAFFNDAVWGGAILVALAGLRLAGVRDVFWYLFSWGAAAGVAAAVGPLQAGVLPRLADARSWVARHRDLGPRYLVEGTSHSASGQLRTYGIGLILGLSAVGYVQAANTLMGPVMIVFFGMGLVALPEAVRALQHSARHLVIFCSMMTAGLALLAVTWGAILLLALPRGLGQLVLASLWRPTDPLILPLTIAVVGGCAMAGAGTGLHALGVARRSMRVMVVCSAIYVVSVLIGAAAGSAVGAVRGAAVAAWIGAVLFWAELRSALREMGYAGLWSHGSVVEVRGVPAAPGEPEGREPVDDGAALEGTAWLEVVDGFPVLAGREDPVVGGCDGLVERWAPIPPGFRLRRVTAPESVRTTWTHRWARPGAGPDVSDGLRPLAEDVPAGGRPRGDGHQPTEP